jgi:hypothetical protein
MDLPSGQTRFAPFVVAQRPGLRAGDRKPQSERLGGWDCHPGRRASRHSWLLGALVSVLGIGNRKARDSVVGIAIRADALRAIRGCSAPWDRRWGTETIKRENRGLWNPTLAAYPSTLKPRAGDPGAQGWGTLVWLSGESGFTAKP